MGTKRTTTDDPVFELAWEINPRTYDDNKRDAKKAWDARLKEGVEPQEMLAGLQAYALVCANEKRENRYIKRLATFFGPAHHYLDYLKAPPVLPDEEEQQFLSWYDKEPLA